MALIEKLSISEDGIYKYLTYDGLPYGLEKALASGNAVEETKRSGMCQTKDPHYPRLGGVKLGCKWPRYRYTVVWVDETRHKPYSKVAEGKLCKEWRKSQPVWAHNKRIGHIDDSKRKVLTYFYLLRWRKGKNLIPRELVTHAASN